MRGMYFIWQRSGGIETVYLDDNNVHIAEAYKVRAILKTISMTPSPIIILKLAVAQYYYRTPWHDHVQAWARSQNEPEPESAQRN